MTLAMLISAALTLASAVAAVSLRNLIHCALALVITFGGLALLYLQLGAQFLGFAQVLVYIGAVSILIVFVILLTRGGEADGSRRFSAGAPLRLVVAILLLLLLLTAAFSSKTLTSMNPDPTLPPSVRELGQELMGRYVLPLEILGLLLTAALIGAAVLALNDDRKSQ